MATRADTFDVRKMGGERESKERERGTNQGRKERERRKETEKEGKKKKGERARKEREKEGERLWGPTSLARPYHRLHLLTEMRRNSRPTLPTKTSHLRTTAQPRNLATAQSSTSPKIHTCIPLTPQWQRAFSPPPLDSTSSKRAAPRCTSLCFQVFTTWMVSLRCTFRVHSPFLTAILCFCW